MWDTAIFQAEGYLGSHSPKLNVGDTQSLVFKPIDSVHGTFHMEKERHNHTIDRQDRAGALNGLRSFSLKLWRKLESSYQNKETTQKELQTFARRHNVDTFEDKQQIIGGWMGQPKGLLQVLWERGLLNEVLLHKYTLAWLTLFTSASTCRVQGFSRGRNGTPVSPSQGGLN